MKIFRVWFAYIFFRAAHPVIIFHELVPTLSPLRVEPGSGDCGKGGAYLLQDRKRQGT